ncbi:protein of unknown function [Blastococcus saxobsidens DD2]|uniref:Uncharacterized protein n=1 Tax=Blastococcus saxobsidens (strain DD2) TaxID=1146883 RepID=H6RMH1_BLASD|nr:protein of unknown function [Blastococcus saxobsidens DD2]
MVRGASGVPPADVVLDRVLGGYWVPRGADVQAR